MSNLAMAPTIRPTTSIQTIDIGFSLLVRSEEPGYFGLGVRLILSQECGHILRHRRGLFRSFGCSVFGPFE
jgi:hypothetical protein